MSEAVKTVGELAGVCGWDGAGWKKVGIDDYGNLYLSVEASVLPSGAATSANQATIITALQQGTITVQAAGGDKIFSFEDVVRDSVADEALPAGDKWLYSTAVPEGKVWKITVGTVLYVGATATRVQLFTIGPADIVCLLDQDTPASGKWYTWNGEQYLAAGDYLGCKIFGATLNDDLYLRCAGVVMDAP